MRFAPDRQIGGGIIRTEPATWAKYVAAPDVRQHRVHDLSAFRCIPHMQNLLTNVQADKLAKLFPDCCRQGNDH